jgi:hypothetical protein
MNSLRAALGVRPQLGLQVVALRICAAHFEPFSWVYAIFSFQFRFWSSIIPRHFVLATRLIVISGSVKGVLATALLLCAKSISTSL